MAGKNPSPNTIDGEAGRVGDVPEAIRRRYFLDDKGGPGTGYYADARVTVPAFRDQGRVLATTRSDPNAIRDMTAIARHRGWLIVTARGAADFRREVWLEGRAAGLEVRGYRPTRRDLQELDRRTARDRRRNLDVPRAPGRASSPPSGAAQARLAVADAVVRARIPNAKDQERVMAAARRRLAHWLEQGARIDPLRVVARTAEKEPKVTRERQR